MQQDRLSYVRSNPFSKAHSLGYPHSPSKHLKVVNLCRRDVTNPFILAKDALHRIAHTS